MPKRNTNTTLPWHLPTQDLLLGVEKLFLIVGAIFLAVFALCLIINVAVDEFRNFVRREVNSALKEQRRQGRRQRAEEQRKRRDVEITPWDSVSNGLRTPQNGKEGVEVVVGEAYFLSHWEKYDEDTRTDSKTCKVSEACWERSQKDQAVEREETEDEKWRRAGSEAGTCLLSEFAGEETSAAEKE